MPTRRRLDARHAAYTLEFELGGIKHLATYAVFDDGGLAELFLNTNGKVGSAADIMASDGATAISLALQYSAPAEVLSQALKRNDNGEPMGALGVALELCMKDAWRRRNE